MFVLNYKISLFANEITTRYPTGIFLFLSFISTTHTSCSSRDLDYFRSGIKPRLQRDERERERERR